MNLAKLGKGDVNLAVLGAQGKVGLVMGVSGHVHQRAPVRERFGGRVQQAAAAAKVAAQQVVLGVVHWLDVVQPL